MKPRMGVNKYGRDGLTYEGVGENKKWERMDTYGPKLVENIVQGTSRDILAEAMMRLKKAGYKGTGSGQTGRYRCGHYHEGNT